MNKYQYSFLQEYEKAMKEAKENQNSQPLNSPVKKDSEEIGRLLDQLHSIKQRIGAIPTSHTPTPFQSNQDLSSAPGIKHDTKKAPYDLLPWDAIEEVVKVLQFGAEKYAARNWEKGISYSRLFAAAQRHLTAFFQNGKDTDPETNLHTLAHAACEVLFMLALSMRAERAGVNTSLDDRPRTPYT